MGSLRRRCRQEHSGQSCWVVAVFALPFVFCNVAVQASKIHTFSLHPTSGLHTDADDDTRGHLRRLAETWLHPSLNGVYATLPKETDSSNVAPDVQDFHAHRHLSRYERQYRIKEQLVDTMKWDGVYRDSNYTAERRLEAHEDPYQIAPLNQGYGTHYVNLWVGSPTPQRKTVIVDTGSHYTAFPCTGCSRCGEGHHTDPFFAPSLSSTFRPLECSECIRGASCHDDKCLFSQSYTEGSSWDAYLAEDLVFCGGNDLLDAADPISQEFAIPFMFGCQTTEVGLFVTQLADGIMGMSAHESTLPKKLYDMGKIDHNMFTMCFNRQLGTSQRGVTAGVMTIGGVDERIHNSPTAYAKNIATMGWYTVFVRNLYIQSDDDNLDPAQRLIRIPIDISAVNSGKGVIVDSGTTDTYLHKKLAKPFGKIWKKVTGKDYHHRPISLTDEQLNQLPTVIVQCAGAYDLSGQQIPNDTGLLAGRLDPSSPNDVLIAIPPTSYMEYSPVAKLYTSRIYFTESQGGVLGANAMIGHNVLFDWENGRIGFAKSDCVHPNESEEARVVEPTVSRNCLLGESTLSESCFENVNVGLCQQSPNRILHGVETWSMVIKDQATHDGLTCEKTASIQAAYKGPEKSTITCNDGGTCTELRPCRLQCSDISDKQHSKAPRARSKSKRQPCDNSWSACDSSCTQTKVISELWTDGLCHEKVRMTRECHTGTCVRSHPCNVPFTVRAEVRFRGARTWSHKWDEAIVNALITAIEEETYDSWYALNLGDVRISSTHPWEENGTNLNGIDVVIEIAIVNTKASVSDDYSNVSEANGLVALAKGFRRAVVQPKRSTECNDAEMFPLAKHALNVKEVLRSAPFLLDGVTNAFGFESAETIAVTVSSAIARDDEVIPLGSFSAGFHTHRLRQYAHHNPLMAVLFFLSVSIIVFGTCSAFEWAITTIMKKASYQSRDMELENTTQDSDSASSTSFEDDDGKLHEQLVYSTPGDDLSVGSDSGHDDMVDRLLRRATCTPPRKVKIEDGPVIIPPFEGSNHGLDESMDRSVSRGASPRKRKIDRHEIESDLEKASRKLERHV